MKLSWVNKYFSEDVDSTGFMWALDVIYWVVFFLVGLWVGLEVSLGMYLQALQN